MGRVPANGVASCTHTRTYSHTHTHINTQTQTKTHTHKHNSHKHTRTLSLSLSRLFSLSQPLPTHTHTLVHVMSPHPLNSDARRKHWQYAGAADRRCPLIIAGTCDNYISNLLFRADPALESYRCCAADRYEDL